MAVAAAVELALAAYFLRESARERVGREDRHAAWLLVAGMGLAGGLTALAALAVWGWR